MYLCEYLWMHGTCIMLSQMLFFSTVFKLLFLDNERKEKIPMPNNVTGELWTVVFQCLSHCSSHGVLLSRITMYVYVDLTERQCIEFHENTKPCILLWENLVNHRFHWKWITKCYLQTTVNKFRIEAIHRQSLTNQNDRKYILHDHNNYHIIFFYRSLYTKDIFDGKILTLNYHTPHCSLSAGS